MFGASSDIGIRTAERLLDAGNQMRLVSRNPNGLDRRAEHMAGDISSAASAAVDADVVISCAHARFTEPLLNALEGANPKLVLMGSAWRYSKVHEERGEAVRSAEAAFLHSNRNGVMLHSTMIYGGRQENNIGRLLSLLRRLPVLPIPGGGTNLVQPIYIEDVVNSLIAATAREWIGPHAIPICGPASMPWRKMAQECAIALGRNTHMLPVPLGPVLALLNGMKRAGIRPPLDPNVLLRLRENVSFSTSDMVSLLAVVPREFKTGIREFIAEQQSIG